jgi:hypothetical protein
MAVAQQHTGDASVRTLYHADNPGFYALSQPAAPAASPQGLDYHAIAVKRSCETSAPDEILSRRVIICFCQGASGGKSV